VHDGPFRTDIGGGPIYPTDEENRAYQRLMARAAGCDCDPTISRMSTAERRRLRVPLPDAEHWNIVHEDGCRLVERSEDPNG
jgi:hypothetical protein